MFSNYFRTLLYFRTLFSSLNLRCSVFSNIVRKWKMFSYFGFSNIVQFLFFSVLFTNFKVGKVLKNPLFTRILEIGLCKCFLPISVYLLIYFQIPFCLDPYANYYVYYPYYY
nr:MAG TPA: hypothetical protein [Caudoviricetes sp.]